MSDFFLHQESQCFSRVTRLVRLKNCQAEFEKEFVSDLVTMSTEKRFYLPFPRDDR